MRSKKVLAVHLHVKLCCPNQWKLFLNISSLPGTSDRNMTQLPPTTLNWVFLTEQPKINDYLCKKCIPSKRWVSLTSVEFPKTTKMWLLAAHHVWVMINKIYSGLHFKITKPVNLIYLKKQKVYIHYNNYPFSWMSIFNWDHSTWDWGQQS